MDRPNSVGTNRILKLYLHQINIFLRELLRELHHHRFLYFFLAENKMQKLQFPLKLCLISVKNNLNMFFLFCVLYCSAFLCAVRLLSVFHDGVFVCMCPCHVCVHCVCPVHTKIFTVKRSDW